MAQAVGVKAQVLALSEGQVLKKPENLKFLA